MAITAEAILEDGGKIPDVILMELVDIWLSNFSSVDQEVIDTIKRFVVSSETEVQFDSQQAQACAELLGFKYSLTDNRMIKPNGWVFKPKFSEERPRVHEMISCDSCGDIYEDIRMFIVILRAELICERCVRLPRYFPYKCESLENILPMHE